MKDSRPISLCNILYKIIAKVWANRLKLLLPKHILGSQAVFIPGRSILDNVILAFELLHYMKRKSHGKLGDVALKVDISKVYDQLDWGFLEQIMLQLGFTRRWVNLIMLCVHTVKYSVIVNDDLVRPILPL